MFIQTQETPNPQTIKFIPGVAVLQSGTKSYASMEEAISSPLAKALFKIEGVKMVFLAIDFITVTKEQNADWSYLKPMILAAIMDHYLSGLPIVIETAPTQANKVEHDEITKQIIELIEVRVRPSVAQDGGDIIFHSFENGIVYLQLNGACNGCPSSTITLKSGIENMLKHYVPEVKAVEAI